MIKVFLSKEEGELSSILDITQLQKYIKEIVVLHSFSRKENFKQLIDSISENEKIVLAGAKWSFYQSKEGKMILDAIVNKGINYNFILLVDLFILSIYGNNKEKNTKIAALLISLAIEELKKRESIEYEDLKPLETVILIGADQFFTKLSKNLMDKRINVIAINKGEIPAEIYTTTQYPFSKIIDFYGIEGNYFLELDSNGIKTTIKASSIVIGTTDNPVFSEELHHIFHIPLSMEKTLIPLDYGENKYQTIYPMIFLLPLEKNEEDIQKISEEIINFVKNKSHRHFFDIPKVNKEICGICGVCVKTCMYKASKIDFEKKTAVVNKYRCVGCGNCVTACPIGARELLSYPNHFLYEKIKNIVNINGRKCIVFACEGSGYPTIEEMIHLGITLPKDFNIIRIRCGAKLDCQFISEAMNAGFKAIAVVCCKEDKCLYSVGSLDLSRRFNLYRAVMRAKGIDPNLLRIITLDRGDIDTCINALKNFSNYIDN